MSKRIILTLVALSIGNAVFAASISSIAQDINTYIGAAVGALLAIAGLKVRSLKGVKRPDHVDTTD